VRPPDREQVEQAAAADVDDVLRQEQRAHVHGLGAEAKQRQVGRLARQLVVGGVEAADLLLGVAARRREQADARVRSLGDVEHVRVERRVAWRRGEAAASHREDAPALAAHAATAASAGLTPS